MSAPPPGKGRKEGSGMTVSKALHILGIVAGIATLLVCLTEYSGMRYAIGLVSLAAFALSDLTERKNQIN